MNTHRVFQAALLIALLVATAGSADPAHAAPDDLPHGPMTRADFVGAKMIPGDKNGELGDAAATSDRYDVLRHRLDLRIDPATESISGSVQMVFESRHAGLTDVVFDLIANLDVGAIDHASGSLAFTHDADSVTVVLPAGLAVGDVDSFVIHYGGEPRNPVVNRGLMFKTHFPLPPIPQENLVPIVANVSQPAYAQSWWPCKDRPDDKFTMTMNLTVPDTLVGVSNGNLVGEAPADPGWRTFSWREDYPIATYLVSVAISDYVLLDEICTTTLGTVVPLDNYVFPRDVDNALVDFAPVCAMMDFSESLWGPYPFAGEKYGHAVFLWPGAMEHQTATSIGSTSINGTGDRAWLIMHELAHQWFGDSLTPLEWADIWLNEGFATYAEALWFEHLDGPGAYATYMANARRESEWSRQGPVYDPVPIFPGRVIYDKGAWILHMLRQRMGDGPFFALLDAWTTGADRPLGHVTTAEFTALASSFAEEDLDGFFTPWLESTAIPQVSFTWSVEEGASGPDTRVVLDLAQRQSPLFDNIYPVVVTTASGTTTVPVNLATAATSVAVDLTEPVLDAILDPDAAVLWNTAAAPDPSAGITLVYPNPARSYVQFRIELTGPASPLLRVYDARGREVAVRQIDPLASGTRDIGYDLADDRGAPLPSGIYWAAVHVGAERSVARFTVVR